MREIEIKARVNDKTALIAILKGLGIILSESVTHRDRVFGLEGGDGGGDNHSPWLRIRTETLGGEIKQIFTFKKSITNQMDSIEHETEVIDADELEKIVLHLGFTPYSDLTKTRQKAKLGNVEICLDTIEKLGDFIEVEKLMPEDADYDSVAAELWSVLEQLGVTRQDYLTDGYDVMMRKHIGLDV